MLTVTTGLSAAAAGCCDGCFEVWRSHNGNPVTDDIRRQLVSSMASTSTTGDLNGAVARLGRELRQLKYTNAVDEVG